MLADVSSLLRLFSEKLVCVLAVLGVILPSCCTKRLLAGHARARFDESNVTFSACDFVLPRLSNASFVSCAAAVGGEKAAGSQPHRPPQNPKGKPKKSGRPGSERTKGPISGHEKGTPNVRAGGGDEVAEPPQGDPATCGEVSTIGVDAVAVELSRRATVPPRRASDPLYFAFDHCFSVRGQGTILTGTVLTGEVKVSANTLLYRFFFATS